MATRADLLDRRAGVLAGLLRVAAVACLIDAVADGLRLVDIARSGDTVLSAARSAGQDGAPMVASAQGQAVFNAVVALAGLLVLTWLIGATRRRAPRSRGGVWLAATALSVALIFGAALDPGTDATPDATQQAPLRAALEQITPGWYGPSTASPPASPSSA